MKQVTQEEYATFVRGYPHEAIHITEGHSVAVAQVLNEEGGVDAHAYYQKGCPPAYYISEKKHEQKHSD